MLFPRVILSEGYFVRGIFCQRIIFSTRRQERVDFISDACLACSFSRMTVHDAISWEAHDRAGSHMHHCIGVKLACFCLARRCVTGGSIHGCLKCAQNLSTVGSVAVSIIVMPMTATEKMSDKRILLLAMHEICPTTSPKMTSPKSGKQSQWRRMR